MKNNRKMIAPIVVGILLVVYFVVYALVILAIPELPVVIKILFAVIPVILAGYAIWAAAERIQEIQGGEEDDLSQY